MVTGETLQPIIMFMVLVLLCRIWRLEQWKCIRIRTSSARGVHRAEGLLIGTNVLFMSQVDLPGDSSAVLHELYLDLSSSKRTLPPKRCGLCTSSWFFCFGYKEEDSCSGALGERLSLERRTESVR